MFEKISKATAGGMSIAAIGIVIIPVVISIDIRGAHRFVVGLGTFIINDGIVRTIPVSPVVVTVKGIRIPCIITIGSIGIGIQPINKCIAGGDIRVSKIITTVVPVGIIIKV